MAVFFVLNSPLFQDCSDGALCDLLTDYAANTYTFFVFNHRLKLNLGRLFVFFLYSVE